MNAITEKENESINSLKKYVDRCSFFNGLDERYRQMLTECAMLREFAQNEQIFNEGDPANRFYVIVEGEVAIESNNAENKPVLVQKIGADDVLGWSWLIPPYRWHFNARATKPTRSIFFYGTRIRDICEENPELGYDLMKRIAAIVIRRLEITRKALLEIHRSKEFP